jgi:hypothetical protein
LSEHDIAASTPMSASKSMTLRDCAAAENTNVLAE